ncbi:MAG: hypothetical protein HYY76_13680 [Acidobacteria bacterium]|nr:hypothetical protein [Acidobacteriota bacterium]
MTQDDRRAHELDLGNPLGIAQEPVEPDERIRAGNDPASVRRRRERALGPRATERTTTSGSRTTLRVRSTWAAAATERTSHHPR